VPNRSSKLEAIHTARHLDVGKYDSDVQATFKNRNGFIRTRRLDDFKCLFDHFDGVQPDQQFIFNDKDDRTFRF
jgi:hypothetical protein